MDQKIAHSKKVLLVDDAAEIHAMYGVELKGKGYSLVEAFDGEEGLVKAKSEKPNLILLDIMMPKMDGIALLSKLKEDSDLKAIPVIMLTNYGQENLIQQAFNLGVSEYLLKYKVTPAEMVDKVKQMFDAAPVQL